MSDKHVMLDLETFSTAPDAAIVQVGAVIFDNFPVETTLAGRGTFERTIALQSSILAGGRMDADTVEWWRHPDRTKPRISVESGAERVGVVLSAFSDWFPEDAYLWSHGAAFDVPVLAHAYRMLGLREPWDHRRVRDTRTLFALAAELAGWEKPRRETAHTALADAVAQAEDVRAAHAALRTRVAFGEARELRLASGDYR
jgi:DNA polymerase III epsilon subunit-like protein